MISRNLKALIAALALTGLLIGALQGAKALKAAQDKKAAEAASANRLPPGDYTPLVSLERDQILRLEYPLLGFNLVKREGRWEAEPPFPGPLSAGEIDSIIWNVSSMSAERTVEENPADLSLYGLDQPQHRLIIAGTGGERIEIAGGSENPSQSGLYVMLAGDPKVYLAPSYSASAISLDPSRIRDKELSPSFEAGDIRRFTVESEKFSIDIKPRPEDDPDLPFFSSHVMTAPYARVRGVSSDKFTELAAAFQNLQIQSFVDPRPASLAPYGLDKPARVYIELAEGPAVELFLGQAEGSLRYARRKDSEEVFTINEPANFAALSPFNLTDKFALILNIADVNTVNVRGGPQELSAAVRRKTNDAGEEEETYYLNGRQAEEKSFKAWYQAVIGLLVDAEHPERPQRGGEPEIYIDYLMDKPAGARPGIRLIPYNRDFYALESGGVVEFLISRSQVRAIFDTAGQMSYLE